MTRCFKYILFFTFLGVVCSCNKPSKEKQQQEEEKLHDFDKIKEKGELTILTLNTSTSFFLYREESMGYDYDFAKDFCKQNNLKLNVKVAKNPDGLLEMLNNGEGDVIAFNIPVLNELKDSITYCGVTNVSHQVLVQRRKKGELLKDVTELIGKSITVRETSKYFQRLSNLNSELGGGILVNTAINDTLTTEDLIEMVSKGEIEYTISDEYIAKLNKTYFRNINIDLAVSFDQRSSWVVSKKATQLAEALNEWFTNNQKETIYQSITKKYFELSKRPFSDEFNLPNNLPKGHISPYDNLFKKHAQNSKFEWQLLAAISYQESRFRNGWTSWAGASGIMGLMPKIAEQYGITEEQRMDPDLSIGVAIKLLNKLDGILKKIEDPSERVKFILASYNGGIGHVSDAGALAEKYGYNRRVWEGNVKEFITKKRQPKYYNDPVCKNGYFRGTETLRYVDDIMNTYSRFKKETTGK